MRRGLALLLALCLLSCACPAWAAEEADQAAEDVLQGVESLLGQTKNLTDEELRDRLSALGESYGFTLSDSQADQLFALCRRLEDVDEGLEDKLAQARKTAQKILELKEKARETARGIRKMAAAAKAFFAKLQVFFQKVFEAVAAFRMLFQASALCLSGVG